MKKFIILAIIAVFIIVVYIISRTVDFGAITIGILERTADIDIEYKDIQGSLFRGYRIEGYNVKLSETDSIYGEIADISYRFKPLAFRLPNLFEINLIKPTVYIKRKIGEGEGRKFTLPHFNLGLRINIKNGKIIYENKNSYTIESISGLIFVDLIGSKIGLHTMNLSLKTKEYPVSITNATLDLRMDSKGIEAHSFKIKGNGIWLYGEGTYSFGKNQAFLKFRKAEINLQKLNIHKGVVIFSGEVEYINDKLLPKIQGTAKGLEPIDRCNFETNVFADAIWINIFDGQLLGGNLFAQVKLLDLKIWEFEANFNDVDIGKVMNSKAPIIISGFMGYKENKFVGHIKSPAEHGLGIDSLLVFGSAQKSQLFLDSLIVLEHEKTLQITGKAYPTYDLTMNFNKFNIDRFSHHIPLGGELIGACHLQGNYENLLDILFTADITVRDFSTVGIGVEKLSVKSKNCRIIDQSGSLNLILRNLSYKNQALEKLTLTLNNRNLSIDAKNINDTLHIAGVFEKNWQGTIPTLYLKYNGIETKNQKPIIFDLFNKKIGAIEISIIDGTLMGTLSPIDLHLSNGNLKKLGMLLGLKKDISGNVNFSMKEDRFSINAQEIDFVGLTNGSLTIEGEYTGKSITVESLTVSDEKQQNIHAQGYLSIENSDVNVKFNNVGAWVLPFLNNFLSKPEGILSGNITLRGNLENFMLLGTGRIENASFGIDVIAAQFDSLSSNVKFDNDRIIFETAKGKVSTMSRLRLSQAIGAEVHAGGVVKLEPRFGSKNYNFDLSFKDAPIQFLPFAYGIGSGNFSVGMKEGTSYYNGNITVKQAIVPIEFGRELEQKEAEDTDNWTMNLKIKGDRNIWLRNSDADIEFGGELYIIKEKGPLYLSGRLETRRGNYYWLNHILKITSGQVTFIPEEELDGELDFWAEMNTREGVKIILHFFGPMSEPVFEFFSEPPLYSEQDIITYLNLNITWKELESMKQEDYVGTVLPHSLISWLESDVSRRIRKGTGIDYVRIETPFFEPEGKTKLTVGKYISKDLFITYTYDITSFANEFNVEYFIDDKNEIFIRKDEEGEYSLQYQYRIRF